MESQPQNPEFRNNPENFKITYQNHSVSQVRASALYGPLLLFFAWMKFFRIITEFRILCIIYIA